MASNNINRAVFLDRDGTLNIECNYLHKKEDWCWIVGVPDALARLKNAGYLLIVVTNQSGIARGFYDKSDVDALHMWMDEDLNRRSGVHFDGIYICPHHPDFGNPCKCRKPEPGMLLTAAKDFNVDLSMSWMIGDKISDIDAGKAAGCRTILVSTGYGADAGVRAKADAMVYDLPQAVDIIVR